MTTNVTLKTKIRVNGQDYESVAELPADVRQAHARALASVNAKTAEKLASGSTQTKLVFNGQEYASVDEMPAAVRDLFERVIATVDANRNGIPDPLETTAQETSRSSLAPTSVPAAAVAGGVVRPDSTHGWLVIAGVVVAAMLLAAFVLAGEKVAFLLSFLSKVSL